MHLRLLIVGWVCLGLAGCGTLRDVAMGAREKLTAREAPRTKVFPATQRETYDAVRTAAGRMGYRFLRGGAAQGEFEAVSGLTANDSLRGSRQISMKVRLDGALDGGTEVSVRRPRSSSRSPPPAPGSRPRRRCATRHSTKCSSARSPKPCQPRRRRVRRTGTTRRAARLAEARFGLRTGWSRRTLTVRGCQSVWSAFAAMLPPA